MQDLKNKTRFRRSDDYTRYRNITGMIRTSGTRIGRPFENFHGIIAYVVDGDVWIFHGGKKLFDSYGKTPEKATAKALKKRNDSDFQEFTYGGEPLTAKELRGMANMLDEGLN